MTSPGNAPYRNLPGVFRYEVDGFMWLMMPDDEDFDARFINNNREITINVYYDIEYTVELELVGSRPADIQVLVLRDRGEGFEPFREVWDELDDPVPNAAAANSAMQIQIISGGHYETKLTLVGAQDIAIFQDTENEGVYTFELSRNVVIQIEFIFKSVTLLRQTLTRQGAEIELYTVGNFEVNDDGDDTMTPVIVDKNESHAGVLGLDFVEWRIRTKDGRLIDIPSSDLKFFTFSGGNISHVLFDMDFIETYMNSFNEIVVVAYFSAKSRLGISVHDNSDVEWHNQYELKVNGTTVNGSWAAGVWVPTKTYEGWVIDEDTDEVINEISVLLPYRANIQIIPIPSPFYTYTDITGVEGLSFPLLSTNSSAILSFESKEFTMTVSNLASNASGTLSPEGEIKFKVGDTITIAFKPNDGHVLDKMTIQMKDGTVKNVNEFASQGMIFSNGTLTIDVTVGWLEIALENEWLDISANPPTFNPGITADANINPMIIVAIVVACVVAVIIILAIVLSMVSIKKKKADYALALVKHKEGQARLRQNIASDLLKDQ